MHIKNTIARCFFEKTTRVLFNRNNAVIASLGFAVLSLIMELRYGWDGFFSASGAFISTAGLFLNIKHSLHFHLDRTRGSLISELVQGAAVFGSDITPEQSSQFDEIILDEVFGVCLMIVGTVVWAYGIYFLKLFKAIFIML